MEDYGTLQAEARDYYALCDRARAAGIPTSLEDPATAQTVEALRAAVEEAERPGYMDDDYDEIITRDNEAGER